MVVFGSRCMITRVMGADVHGRPIGDAKWEEACSIIKFVGDDTDVSQRIGSTPDYPISKQRVADVVLLLPITTKAGVNDMLEIAGVKLKVIGISASYDSVGKFANYVAEAMLWE